jgi:hypothetical protein
LLLASAAFSKACLTKKEQIEEYFKLLFTTGDEKTEKVHGVLCWQTQVFP